MTLDAKILPETDPLTAGLQDIVDRKECTEDDLQALRLALYRSSPIDHEKVLRLFDAHQKMPAKDRLWAEFFIEAVAEFFLTRLDGQIVLNELAENQLLDAIGEIPTIIDDGHKRLATRLLLRTTKAPERLQVLVFNTVREHFLKDNRRLLIDLPRQAGTLDIVDLHLIRKLVLGAGGQYPSRINRVAVDFLLALDQAPLSFAEPDAWKALLFSAVSSHIFAGHPDRDEGDSEIDEDAAYRLIQHLHKNYRGHHKALLIAHLTCDAEPHLVSNQATDQPTPI